FLLFYLYRYVAHRDLHSFPTRRSSDLAVVRGNRLKVWKTKPISLFRISASSLSFILLTSFPFSIYSPEVGVSKHPRIFIKVDFPEPEGPIRATYSPFSI